VQGHPLIFDFSTGHENQISHTGLLHTSTSNGNSSSSNNDNDCNTRSAAKRFFYFVTYFWIHVPFGMKAYPYFDL
jgi:hypothetical protein